jgi:archaemetzincin
MVASLWAMPFDQFAKVDILKLQPLGKVSQAELNVATNAIQQEFNVKLLVIASVDVPVSAYYPPRSRYRAERLLRFLSGSQSGTRTIGLTESDISTTNGKVQDWGVLGLGSEPFKACVVSTFRMDSPQARGFKYRLANTMIHEIGHTYGLPHCTVPGCVMNDAKGSIKVFDRIKHDFCSSCREHLPSGLLCRSFTDE